MAFTNVWEMYDPRSSNYLLSRQPFSQFSGYNSAYQARENNLQTNYIGYGSDLYNMKQRQNQALAKSYADSLNNDPNKPGYFTQFWNSFKDETLKKPMEALGGIGSIWNMYQDYRNTKDYINLQRDAYNTQKELALQSNQRAQESFDMSKANRAGHQL